MRFFSSYFFFTFKAPLHDCDSGVNYRYFSPFGQSLQPLLNSLSASSSQSGIPVFPLDLDGGRTVIRAPSPGAVELERAIEDARRDSLKLEERRTTILEKVEKLEKKKAKKQQQQQHQERHSSSSSVPEKKMADASEAVDGSEVEETQPPREPPIVYKGNLISIIELIDN